MTRVQDADHNLGLTRRGGQPPQHEVVALGATPRFNGNRRYYGYQD
jgi:hypothetical protein